MELSKQIAIGVTAEAKRKGATVATCAGLYAVAIGIAAGHGADYWRPLNETLEAAFGARGRDRVKATAWKIHDNAAAALKATLH